MKLYSNPEKKKKQVQSEQSQQKEFCQQHPNWRCKNREKLAYISNANSYEFPIKCRNPRCSIDCKNNYINKMSSCIAYHLQSLPNSISIHRGSLHLPSGLTAGDHRHCKELFRERLNRYRKRHNCNVELHAMMDFSADRSMHWDVLLYTDLSANKVRQLMSAWKECGGSHYSLSGVDDEEINAAARYQVKDVKIGKDKIRKQRYQYLPRPRSEIGLEFSWHTSSFWQGKKMEEIWHEIINRWLEAQKEKTDRVQSIKTNLDSQTSSNSDPKIDLFPEFESIPEPFVYQDPLSDFSAACSFLQQVLPRSEEGSNDIIMIA